MEAESNELEEQLRRIGVRLAAPPLNSVDDLLGLLDETESLLSKVDQSPSNSMSNSLRPAMKALIAKEFLRHQDRDVKVHVVACLSEITRITAPDAPYDDETMKEIFQRIVETFENLDDISSRSSAKRFTILETVAKVRSCVVMLDLECDDLILAMFQYFFKKIGSNHAANVFSSMETIMTLVLEESEDISQDLISCLLENVKVNDGVPTDAQRLGECVIKNCAKKLMPYLKELPPHSVSEYSQVVASIVQGTTAVVQDEKHVSGETTVEDRRLSERTISDLLPQGSAKTEQEAGCQDEHAEAGEKSSKPLTNNDTVYIGNGESDVKESLPKEKPEVSCPSDRLKMSSEDDRELDSVDINSDVVLDELANPSDKKASSDQMKNTVDHTLEVQLEKEAETYDKDELNSSEACTGVSKFPSPIHVGDPDATGPKHVRSAKSAKRRGGGAVGVDIVRDVLKKASGKNVSSVQMDDAVDHTLDIHHEKDTETSDKDEQLSSEAGTGMSKVPSPVHDEDPVAATGPRRGRSAKSAKRRVVDAAGGNLAPPSGRKEPADASRVKSENLPSKNSSSKKESSSFSDSERRLSKESGKKSQPVKTDRTPEYTEVKSPRLTMKRGSSASKVSQEESSLKQQKLKVKQQDELKPKKEGSGQDTAKEMFSSPRSVNKPKVEDNLEDNLNTSSRRKRALGVEEVIETPARSKLDESIVGAKIKVWWPFDKMYYEGVIESYEPSSRKHKILYTDGDIEVLYLKKQRWEFINNRSDFDEDIAIPDASMDKSHGKRAKTSTSSVPKDAAVDASRKSGTGSGSVAKRKGTPSIASTPKIDELHDDSSPEATNKTKDKAASRSSAKLSKHNTLSAERSNSKTVNSLLNDAARSSRKSRDETNKTSYKNKNGPISSGSKEKKENVHKDKLSEETPKAGQKSKSGGEKKANGSSAKGKPDVQETESSARTLSGEGKVAEKDTLSKRKRKRK